MAFVDLDLPGIDGLELARLLRAQGQRLGLIALTARADPNAERDALEAGEDYESIIRVPFKMIEIVE